MRSQRGSGFTLLGAGGKIQVVGGVGGKPFGVDSAGGFLIGHACAHLDGVGAHGLRPPLVAMWFAG